jgi:hypothetical protein
MADPNEIAALKASFAGALLHVRSNSSRDRQKNRANDQD